MADFNNPVRRRTAAYLPVGVVFGVMLGLTAVACKKSAPSRAPLDLRDLSLDEIENELERNRIALGDAGVYVAAASVASPSPPPTINAGGDDDGDETEAAITDDADPRIEPEPEPDNEPSAPMASPESAGQRVFQSGRSRSNRAIREERQAEELRCDRICDLAETSCALEVQICDLASRHPDEPRYALACANAEEQCVAAENACDDCER